MSDYLSTAPYKGTRDFYPPEMRVRSWMFSVIEKTVVSFGFEKIDAPLIEPVEIYLAKTSEEIVNQQIYSFIDRGDRKVAIRPEMTPTVARMAAARIRDLPRPIRWYSLPNLWRYEKPGKGRLREHWQFNADIFGSADESLADLEIIQLALELFSAFGATENHYKIFINHRAVLNAVFEKILKIPGDKWANVSRIMDKKDKVSGEEFQSMLRGEGLGEIQIRELELYVNSGINYLINSSISGENCVKHLVETLEMTHEISGGKIVHYNPSVVRGFDYYTGIVFEIFDLHPENRRSLAGGGRYDNLVTAFTKDTVNAIGFGMGDVTFMDFLKNHGLIPDIQNHSQVYVAAFSEKNLRMNAIKISRLLRNAGFNVELSSGHKKLGKQFDEAHSKKIPIVVLQGETEAQKNTVIIKEMSTGAQQEVAMEELLATLKKTIS
ncbi:MAG: histidine--tRNA ligase [Spirochaetia bacterium]|nr:histidine--tRNA ligase [Spirochaetia bacterium]